MDEVNDAEMLQGFCQTCDWLFGVKQYEELFLLWEAYQSGPAACKALEKKYRERMRCAEQYDIGVAYCVSNAARSFHDGFYDGAHEEAAWTLRADTPVYQAIYGDTDRLAENQFFTKDDFECYGWAKPFSGGEPPFTVKGRLFDGTGYTLIVDGTGTTLDVPALWVLYERRQTWASLREAGLWVLSFPRRLTLDDFWEQGFTEC